MTDDELNQRIINALKFISTGRAIDIAELIGTNCYSPLYVAIRFQLSKMEISGVVIKEHIIFKGKRKSYYSLVEGW